MAVWPTEAYRSSLTTIARLIAATDRLPQTSATPATAVTGTTTPRSSSTMDQLNAGDSANSAAIGGPTPVTAPAYRAATNAAAPPAARRTSAPGSG